MAKTMNHYVPPVTEARDAEFIGATLTGIAPRSNESAKKHRLLRDGYVSESEFKAILKRDQRALVSAQKSFAFVSDGQLDWADIIRPLAHSFAGFGRKDSSGEDAVGPVTRWFRTNTFYRRPSITGKLDCRPGALSEFVPSGIGKSTIFLLAPYSFVKLVDDEFYHDEKNLAAEYARTIAKGADKLYRDGYRCMILTDPYVGYAQSRGEVGLPSWYPAAVSRCKAPGLKLGLNLPQAETSEVSDLLNETNLDFFGIDTTFSSPKKIETSKDILFGLVDGARPTIETQADMQRTLSQFMSHVSFSGKFYIGPNDRLYDVPFETAIAKIKALSLFSNAVG